MPNKERRAELRKKQATEVEESQTALRESIAQTQRLVSKSDDMLERHRREQETSESEE